MKLNEEGNYLPWTQPQYGTDAQGNLVTAPERYTIVPEGEQIKNRWLVFDVYAGWIIPDGYNARNKMHARSSGRWTTWARPVRRSNR